MITISKALAGLLFIGLYGSVMGRRPLLLDRKFIRMSNKEIRRVLE